MHLDGLHHITMITADAQANVAFYGDVLGLRLVKKTVNFDAPDAYHLYFGDEQGAPGSILTWFEFPGAARGRAGLGDIHTLQLAVAAPAALGFWADRLREHGHASERTDERTLRFADPDGLAARARRRVARQPAAARRASGDPRAEHAILGVEGARAYVAFAPVEESLYTDVLGFTHAGGGEYVLEGGARRFRWGLDPARAHGGQGAGSVHHIAWASRDEDHLAWQERVRAAGGHVTDVRDRDYFKSIYFREPRGVLFEIATLSPGFAVDEDPEHLGEDLRLPRMHEHLRAQLEQILAPVSNPRVAA